MNELEQLRHNYVLRKSFLVQLYQKSYEKQNLLENCNDYILLLVDLITNPANGKILDATARNSIYDIINFYRDLLKDAKDDKGYEQVNELIVLANKLEPFDPTFYQQQYEMRFPFLKTKNFGQTEAQRESIYHALLIDVIILSNLSLPFEEYTKLLPGYQGNMFYLASIYTFLKEFPQLFEIEDYKEKLIAPLSLNQQDHCEQLLESMFRVLNINDRRKDRRVIVANKRLYKQIQKLK